MWKLCFINRTTPPKFNVSPLRKDEPLNFRSVGSWLFSHYVAAPFLNRIFFWVDWTLLVGYCAWIMSYFGEISSNLAVLRHSLWQKMMSRLCTDGVSHPIFEARAVHFRNCIFRFYLLFCRFQTHWHCFQKAALDDSSIFNELSPELRSDVVPRFLVDLARWAPTIVRNEVINVINGLINA